MPCACLSPPRFVFVGRNPSHERPRGRLRPCLGAAPHPLASRSRAGQVGAMKIATFNINNINKRLANLTGWLRATKPDVVALQELKSTDADFPAAALRRAGYQAVFRGQKSWN